MADTRKITFDLNRLPAFKAEIDRLIKIAERLHVEPVTFAIVATGERKELDLYDCGPLGAYSVPGGLVIKTVTVEIAGTSPRLPGGWRVLGVIEHANAGNLVHGDDPRLAPYRDGAADCEHCGFKRNRKSTVILHNDSGAFTQVGSACLKDFLGYHGDPDKVLYYSEDLDKLDDDDPAWLYENNGSRDDTVPTAIYMQAVAGIVRCHGFVPRSAAFSGVPTAEIAEAILRPWPKWRDNKTLLPFPTVYSIGPIQSQATPITTTLAIFG